MSGAAPQADPRRFVLQLLLDEGEFPTRAFPQAVQAAGLADRDRSLARQLLGGVLRRAVQLDAIAEPFCERRVTDPAVRWTLRLGVLQLFFLSQVPPHAAVHATIQAARPFLRERTGFAHAVLRTVQRKARAETPAQSEFTRRRLVVGKRSWVFDRAVFHDPEKFPVEYQAQALGYPVALVRRWFEACGPKQAVARMQALNEVPPLFLRVNLARCSREQLASRLRETGAEVTLAEHERFLILRRPGRELSALPGFAEGHFAVQDLTSFESVELARPQAGERVLDLCAAPGGKSFAIGELTDGQAQILACDTDARRLAKLAPEAERLGLRVATQVLGGDGFAYPPGPFDLIVLDVPCTNTGVLHKRPEARARYSKEELHRATTVQNLIRKAVQKQLIAGADPPPRVLWTTCSLEPEENADMARRFARQTGYELVRERHFEPDGRRAGGYAAILEYPTQTEQGG